MSRLNGERILLEALKLIVKGYRPGEPAHEIALQAMRDFIAAPLDAPTAAYEAQRDVSGDDVIGVEYTLAKERE